MYSLLKAVYTIVYTYIGQVPYKAETVLCTLIPTFLVFRKFYCQRIVFYSTIYLEHNVYCIVM